MSRERDLAEQHESFPQNHEGWQNRFFHCRRTKRDVALIFPERCERKMKHRIVEEFETLSPLRFLSRSTVWTGSGVQGYPWIQAWSEGKPLINARVHGPAYWDDKSRGYHIDLGEFLDQGVRFTLYTEAMFIDESGTFKPRNIVRTPETLEELKITVAFKNPPNSATYKYSKSLERAATHCTEEVLKLEERFGMPAFNVVIFNCPMGQHGVYWKSLPC